MIDFNSAAKLAHRYDRTRHSKWKMENGKVLAEWCGAITAGNGK
jgi:hypothetical protein